MQAENSVRASQQWHRFVKGACLSLFSSKLSFFNVGFVSAGTSWQHFCLFCWPSYCFCGNVISPTDKALLLRETPGIPMNIKVERIRQIFAFNLQWISKGLTILPKRKIADPTPAPPTHWLVGEHSFGSDWMRHGWKQEMLENRMEI